LASRQTLRAEENAARKLADHGYRNLDSAVFGNDSLNLRHHPEIISNAPENSQKFPLTGEHSFLRDGVNSRLIHSSVAFSVDPCAIEGLRFGMKHWGARWRAMRLVAEIIPMEPDPDHAGAREC